MHNCKLTRTVLLDLALGETPPAQMSELLAELKTCAACQAEYATLRNTLRVSQQALRSASPAEEFWPGYHARLSARLVQHRENGRENLSVSVPPAQLSWGSRLLIAARQMATTSVRVPVPAALALVLLLGVSFFVVRSRGVASATSSTPLAFVETRTVHVPVIQERVVTQVVYVEKKRSRFKGPPGLPGSLDPAGPNTSNTSARAGSDASGRTAMSLVGFKPTDQVKLTIIKGSYQDEK